MELVYLWVEDYKNIQKQGFNFSPKFNCDYDDVTNELTINENDDYIPDFFGENINVTAIVGKNGSGKSSVLKLILFMIFCKNYKKYQKKGYFNIGRFLPVLKIFANKEIFLIIHNGKKFKKITFSEIIRHLQNSEFGDKITTRVATGSEVKESEILKDIPELKESELTFFTVYLNYMLDTLADGFHDNWINQIYHKEDNYETPLLLQPNKYDKNTQNNIIDLGMLDFLNNQKLLLLYKDISKNKNFTSFFNPTNLKIKSSYTEFLLNASTSDSVELNKMRKITNKLTIFLVKYQDKIDSKKLDNTEMHPLLKEIDEKLNYKYMNLLYLLFKILLIDKLLFDREIYKRLEEDTIKCINKSILPTEDYLNDVDYKKLTLTTNKLDYRVKKILISIEFHSKEIYNKQYFKNLLNNETVKISDIEYINSLPSWIDYEFYDNKKSLSSLSGGEQSLLRILIDIIYQVEKIKQTYKSVNIMLDEVELGLHPQWQKEYLKNILKSVSTFIDGDFKINIVFATHSPFLLSDIPKENIIFLEKDDNGNCKVDGLKEKKQTFGANIHTLLSDSFFMKDGLMGEFAKNKIQEIMDFLNDKKDIEDISTKEEQIKQVIESIGEPFLKQKLLEMYYKKFKDEASKKARKDELLAEQKRIAVELKKYD